MTDKEEKRFLKLLEDIQTSAERIVHVLAGVTQEEFVHIQNLDAQDIVAHRFSMIGEAAAVIVTKYAELCDEAVLLPMRQAKGMRNKLIHEYASVNWDIVWETAQQSIPLLLAAIAPLIARLRQSLYTQD